MPRKYPKAEIGQVFGKWTVVGEGERRRGMRAMLCRCACGVQSVVVEVALNNGTSLQCGKCRSAAAFAKVEPTNVLSANRARAKYTTRIMGDEVLLVDAAREFGVPAKLARRRLRRGSDPFSAHNTRTVRINGQWVTQTEAAELAGIPRTTLRKRLSLGWTLPQALGIEPPPPRRRK